MEFGVSIPSVKKKRSVEPTLYYAALHSVMFLMTSSLFLLFSSFPLYILFFFFCRLRVCLSAANVYALRLFLCHIFTYFCLLLCITSTETIRLIRDGTRMGQGTLRAQAHLPVHTAPGQLLHIPDVGSFCSLSFFFVSRRRTSVNDCISLAVNKRPLSRN